MVRHAESVGNSQGIAQGHFDSPLTERGRLQAKALRARLEKTEIRSAYSSDLVRATDTARAILAQRDVPLSYSARLRELSYGRWEGMTNDEVQRTDPGPYREMLERTNDFAPPGGESLHELWGRTDSFVSRIETDHPGAVPLLIVGHGVSLRVLLCRLLRLPVESAWLFALSNASLSVVECHAGSAVLRLLNDTSHWRETGDGS